MRTKQNKLDELKGRNPFKLPEGYMEGLTEQIMAKVPESSYKETKVIPLFDRVRPWLYLAGVFAGLLLFFRIFISPGSMEDKSKDQPLYVHAMVSGEVLQAISEEDEEYLEYLESEYLKEVITEELENVE